MKDIKLPFLIVLGFGLLMLASSSFFTVQQTQSALVLQFGRVVNVYTEPGLKFKVPFIQEVTFYDKFLLHYNVPALEINAADQKRLVVDIFTRYKIIDVLKFYRTIGQDTSLVENRLSGLVLDYMQQVIGRIPLSEMLSEKREHILSEIHEKVRVAALTFGIDVVDVRIVRADLPKENSEAIFARMESERVQEAKLFRAEGDEYNQRIRAKADRDRTVILADARKKAEIIRGAGEAKATDIYAKSYGRDQAFFERFRTYQAYEKALTPEDTTVILSTKDTPMLKYMSK